jgi:hypothetical protein
MNPGAKQISMSNSDVALSDDVFSLFNNPGGLAQLNWSELGVFYSPAPFGLIELASGYVAYHEPLGFGSIGIGAMTYGYELYRECKVLFAFATRYKNIIFPGISVNYHSVSIKGYGSKGVLYFNAGCLAYITNHFRTGFVLTNINRASFTEGEEQIPVVLNTGFSYDVSDNLSLNAAVEKDIRYNVSVMSGINYDLSDYFSLRIGFANEPAKYSCGIGINYSILSFDYAVFTHPELGLTHQVGIIVSFEKEISRTKKIRNFLRRD